MYSLNKVLLIGYLGKDPEIHRSQNGHTIARFSLATNEQWKDSSGERQERTEWHNIVAWNKLAEICEQYLTKGQPIYVEGRIQNREYDDRDGNRRHITEVIARQIRMLGPREASVDGDGQNSRPWETTGAGASSAPPPMDDSDIPF